MNEELEKYKTEGGFIDEISLAEDLKGLPRNSLSYHWMLFDERRKELAQQFPVYAEAMKINEELAK